LAKTLRVDERCDFVIAITHMRLIEDLDVANATMNGESRVDLVLGGHDHQVLCRLAGDTNVDPEAIMEGKLNDDIIEGGRVRPNVEGNVRIVKSGTDWRSYSIIRLMVDSSPDKKPEVKASRVEQWTDITLDQAYSSFPISHTMTTTLSSIYGRITKTVQHPLFHSRVPLDGRSSVIRSQETNLGNLIADAVREFYGTDIAIVNSGGIRCDRVIEPRANGETTALTVKDMIERISNTFSLVPDILPFDNPFVVKRVHGTHLLNALSNSLSNAHTDGRFLQLSGLRISASWHRPEHDRLITAHYCPRGSSTTPIAPEQTYTVAMVSFIAAGFDGYSGFKAAETVVGEEGAMTDTGLLLRVLGYGDRAEEAAREKKKSGVDDTDEGVARARGAIIVAYDPADGLPVVGPAVDGRIGFQGETAHL
ncbi:MAG: hypothetical protein Q9166_006233, partial [cf. Caloplaca sp. 2 TL-2023]